MKRLSERYGIVLLLSVLVSSAPILAAAGAKPAPLRGLQEVSHSQVDVRGGFSGPRLETHHEATVPHALDELEKDGQTRMLARPGPSATEPVGINFGLGALPLMSDAQTRSISPENPTGEKGKGAMIIPKFGDPEQPHANLFAHLGQGWKTRPFLTLAAGTNRTLMDVNGPGTIQHIWIVVDDDKWRSCVVRFYWDNETTPSIEAPLSDFFAVGHGKFAPVNSLPVLVNARSALNCFWPMPFRKHARMTLANESTANVGLLTYQITYAEGPLPENAAYFHAQYRRASTAQQNPYVILDGVKGRGQYVGTFLAWLQTTDEWFGEGEIKFYLDGDREFPTICGTGTEDYFLSS